MTFFITIPAAVGLSVLSVPVIRILFERGSFSPDATALTARALVFFAIGLPFISGVRVTANAFFSLQDSRTPVRCANGAVLANVILSLVLMSPMGHSGLALAVSAASIVNLLTQLFTLRHKIGRLGLRKGGGGVAQAGAASLVMGVVVRFLSPHAEGVTGLLLVILAGVVSYFLAAALFRSPEAGEIRRQLLSLRWRGAGT